MREGCHHFLGHPINSTKVLQETSNKRNCDIKTQHLNANLRKVKYTYVGPPYCRAKAYTGRVACCPLVNHGDYADDRQTDTRPLHYAFC